MTTSPPAVRTLPDGAWPVMLTPFSADLAVDGSAIDAYTDWLIDQGAAGLFPVALSGEMYELSGAERLAVAARVVTRAAGRVPVLAAVAEAGTAEQVTASVARLAATGVTAVVLIASLLLDEGESETELQPRIDAVLAANPGTLFGLYECPLPYHRILSTDAVAGIAATGRFVFFKETSHDVALMAERVGAAAGTPMKVYNAGIENLVESLEVGVAGLSGWVVNVLPGPVAWLCANGSANTNPDSPGGERATRAEILRVQAALTAVERGMGPGYPNSAKHLVAQGSPVAMRPVSRWRVVVDRCRGPRCTRRDVRRARGAVARARLTPAAAPAHRATLAP